MFSITVTEKGGEQRRLDFDKPEITIGRVQGNDVILPKGNVSKRHARIVLKDGKYIIVDLKSTNGTYVNGRKITSPLVIKETDKIYIGDYIMGVDENGAGEASAPPEPPMDRGDNGRSQLSSQTSPPPMRGYDGPPPPGGQASPELLGAAMSRPAPAAPPRPEPRMPPPGGGYPGPSHDDAPRPPP